MGNTFASLHVLDSDFDTIECALSNCQLDYSRDLEKTGSIDALSNDLKEKNDFSYIETILGFLFDHGNKKREFLCINQNSFISIFSDYIVFENSDYIAQSYFENYDCTVFSVKMFDGDVFSLNVYRKGDLIDSFVVGKNLEDFNLFENNLKKSTIYKSFLSEPIELKSLIKVGDCELISEYLSSVMGISFDIKSVNINNANRFVY